MNKTDTIDHIARSADLSKEAAGRVMDAFEARLKAHTAEGKRVVLRGFGSFSRGLPAQVQQPRYPGVRGLGDRARHIEVEDRLG